MKPIQSDITQVLANKSTGQATTKRFVWCEQTKSLSNQLAIGVVSEI